MKRMILGLVVGLTLAVSGNVAQAASTPPTLKNIGPGVSVQGCCQSTEPIASEQSLIDIATQEIMMMEFWRRSNESAIARAATSINIGTGSSGKSTSGIAISSAANTMLAEKIADSQINFSEGLSQSDLACIPNLSYYWIKARDAVRMAAASMSANQKNILLGQNLNRRDITRAHAERAEVAKKDAFPFADLTLNKDELAGTQAYIDLFYTADVPDPDPATNENSQRLDQWKKKKMQYIFTQMVAAGPMNDWLASRSPIAPSDEILKTLAFYDLEAPTTTSYNTDSKGMVSGSTIKAIGKGEKMSLEAVLDSMAKIVMTDKFQDEDLNVQRTLVNVLKADAISANMLYSIKNSIEKNNIMLSMVLGLLNERQYEALNTALQ